MNAAAAAPAPPVVVITGDAGELIRRIATDLTASGHPVAVAAPSGAAETAAASTRDGTRAIGTTVDLADRDQIDAVLSAATSLGRLGAVVAIHCPAEATSAQPIAELDPGTWDSRCEAPIRTCLVTLQAAYAALQDGGGTIVVVTPTASLIGAPGLVPLTAAAEAQRILAKSAARRWGRSGITVNVLALPLQAFHDGGSGDARAAFLGPDALPAAAPATDAAAVIGYLTGPEAKGVTGATICLDGGVVMA